ncbi:MAG: hypothetical protein KY456_17120, partial [Chloroflexi bacterium]|nr:hypothetical protein [Chloroflexota bacterium]
VDAPVWERVCQVLRDPSVIAREVAKHRTEGGLDRDLSAVEKRLAGIVAKQQRIAKAIASVDDDAAAEPLLEELKVLSGAKAATERERDDLGRRIADQAQEAQRVRSLEAWCETVSMNLNTLSYAEKRLALDALGVEVRVFRLGAVDAEGNPLPRWEMRLNPVASDEGFLYPSNSFYT